MPSIAVLGTGQVGQAIARRAAEVGYELWARLQRAFPDTRVVKTLNTMNNAVMVRPAAIPGDHLVFLSGDSPTAKDATRLLLRAFGWRDAQMMDLGGTDTAAATEMMMAIWMQVTIARGPGAPRFNWAVLEGGPR